MKLNTVAIIKPECRKQIACLLELDDIFSDNPEGAELYVDLGALQKEGKHKIPPEAVRQYILLAQ